MYDTIPPCPCHPTHTLCDTCRSPEPGPGLPPGTPKDPRSGSLLPGVPTEPPSPERAESRTRSPRGSPQSLEGSPRLGSAPPWRPDSPRTTRPHRHQRIRRSSRRNPSAHGAQPAKCPLARASPPSATRSGAQPAGPRSPLPRPQSPLPPPSPSPATRWPAQRRPGGARRWRRGRGKPPAPFARFK